MSENSSDAERKHRRSEAFFGRRKSKALSPAQAQRFERLYPRLGIDVSTATPATVSNLFPHTPDAIVMEIGFGGGEHLIHQATTYPEYGFIGIEPFVNSMAKILRVIDEHSIDNIRLYNEDAVEVLDWLPDQSIDRIDLLYPDPWPKMRHWKRRFVTPKNLDRISRVLKPDAEFRFASDIDTYINWTIQHCNRHTEFEWNAMSSADWEEPYENWVQTRYEAKAMTEGRRPCYLRFKRR